MSGETPAGLTLVEKLSGLISVFLGTVVVYFTSIDPPKSGGRVESYSLAFLIGGFILLVLGILLLLVKAE